MNFDINKTFSEALALHQSGQFAEAEQRYWQILAHNPNHVDSLHLLGVIFYEAGRHAEALGLIGKAIAMNDRVADFHCNMGLVQFALGHRETAVAHYTRAIALDPRHALSYNNLGNALTEMGRPQEGEASLRRAIALKPEYAQAYYNLGNTLAAQGKLDEAVAVYRRGIALAPNVANGHNNLGTALERQGKLDEAEAALRRALEFEPQHPSALYNLGNILKNKADYEGAIALYRKSLAGRPEFADAWNNMGAVLAERGDLDEARSVYQKAVEVEPERERIDLQFALGKAYADLKQHERSFRCLLAGNALKRAQIAYNEVEALQYMQRIRTVFDPELLRAKAGHGDPAPTPVFIVGMPRSGTTLIEQIIASHPKALGAGELIDLDNIVRSIAGRNGAALRFPEVVATMSGEELRQVGARYVAATRAHGPSAERIADKMPWNFHFAGLIHLALPNARIIHARRDPVDTCLSCFSILFENGNPYTYDLGELGRFYRGYDSLMAHWRSVFPQGVMIEVQYEEVVADLETQARQIMAHCDLEWDEACLAFHKTRRPVRTSSVAQVRQPIYQSSVGRWRPYREQLRPLLEELGVDQDSVPPRPLRFPASRPRPTYRMH